MILEELMLIEKVQSQATNDFQIYYQNEYGLLHLIFLQNLFVNLCGVTITCITVAKLVPLIRSALSSASSVEASILFPPRATLDSSPLKDRLI